MVEKVVPQPRKCSEGLYTALRRKNRRDQKRCVFLCIIYNYTSCECTYIYIYNITYIYVNYQEQFKMTPSVKKNRRH